MHDALYHWCREASQPLALEKAHPMSDATQDQAESPFTKAALPGYLIWGDVPEAWLLAGALLVIASGSMLIRLDRTNRQT
jgi:hypothetical protein